MCDEEFFLGTGVRNDAHRFYSADHQGVPNEIHEGRFDVHAHQLLDLCVRMVGLWFLYLRFGFDFERDFLPYRYDDFGHAENFL